MWPEIKCFADLMGCFSSHFSRQSHDGTIFLPDNIGKWPGTWCCNLCRIGQERLFYQVAKTKQTNVFNVQGREQQALLCVDSCPFPLFIQQHFHFFFFIPFQSSLCSHGLASFLPPSIFHFCRFSSQRASFHHFHCAEMSELVSPHRTPLFLVHCLIRATAGC